MVDERLEEWLRKNARKGYSREQLKEAMREHGWDPDAADEILGPRDERKSRQQPRRRRPEPSPERRGRGEDEPVMDRRPRDEQRRREAQPREKGKTAIDISGKPPVEPNEPGESAFEKINWTVVIAIVVIGLFIGGLLLFRQFLGNIITGAAP